MKIAPHEDQQDDKPAFTALNIDTSAERAGGAPPPAAASPGLDVSTTIDMGATGLLGVTTSHLDDPSSLPDRITPTRPHLKRDTSGSLARAISKHAETKARKAKKHFGGNLSPSMEGSQGSPKLAVTKHRNSAYFQNPWARAYYGTLISVVEKSGSGSKNLQVRRVQYWFPIADMLIQFFQLSAINDFTIPVFNVRTLQFAIFLKRLLLLQFTLFKLGPVGLRIAFAVATVAVILLIALLLLLGYLFAKRRADKTFVQAVSLYIGIITGIGFMPCFDNLERVMESGFMRGQRAGAVVQGLVSLLCLIYLVSFTLMIGQNAFPNDPNSFNLMKRRHNRMDLMGIVTKVFVLVGARTSDVSRRAINLSLFLTMFCLHFNTYAYYVPLINRCYNAYYVCLIYGAACRLAISMTAHKEMQHNIELGYWAALVLVLLFAMAMNVPSFDIVRNKLNEMLISKLSFFDLADNSELIYSFDLSSLLKSATRMGNYAQYLLEHKAMEVATNFFLKALKEDPLHADNLGRYADLLMQQEKHEEAQDYYRLALKADPENRQNLERYASFLATHDMDDALFYYQRSVLGYMEHYNYRELYSQSSDAMFITDLEGGIQDCNGAALHLFKTSTRADLCANRSIYDLTSIDAVDSFRKSIDTLLNEGLPNTRFETTVKTFKNKTLTVSVVVTRMKHGSSIVLHISMVDVTDLKRLLETNALIFEKSLSPMIMIDTRGTVLQYNECAVQTFGYTKEEVLKHNITILMPPEIAAKHHTYVDRYLSTGVKRVVGAVRDVPVRTKAGDIRTCSLRLNELHVGGERFFIGILMDVTDLVAALEKSAAIFEKGLSPMLVIDTKAIVIGYNEYAETRFGFTKEEAIGRNVKFLMPSEIANKHDGYIRTFNETGKRNVIGKPREVPVVTKSGEVLTCILRVNQLGANSFIGIFDDITERKRAAELSDAMFELASSPMILLDRQCIIRRFNGYAEETFGYTKEEAIENNVKMLMKPEVALLHDGYISRYMATKQPHVIGSQREVEAVSKTGQVFKVMLRVNEIETEATSFFIGIMHILDKSRRKSVEQAVARRSSTSSRSSTSGGSSPSTRGSRRESLDFIGEEDEEEEQRKENEKQEEEGETKGDEKTVSLCQGTTARLQQAAEALGRESDALNQEAMAKTGEELV